MRVKGHLRKSYLRKVKGKGKVRVKASRVKGYNRKKAGAKKRR